MLESLDHHREQIFSSHNRVLHSQDQHILSPSIKQLTLKLPKNVSLLLGTKIAQISRHKIFFLPRLDALKTTFAGGPELFIYQIRLRLRC